MKQKIWKPEAELVNELEAAAKSVIVGARYFHFKHPDQFYTVLDIIWDTTEEGPAVLYRAEYGSQLTFSRPVRIWLETVEHQDKTVQRFIKVSDD